MKSLEAYSAYLAQRHAQDQENIAAQLAVALYPLWSLVRFQELDDSMPMWLASVLPRVKTAFLQSQRVGAVFAQNARFATLPTAEPFPISVPDVEQPVGLSAGAFSMPDLGPGEATPVFDAFDPQRVATSLTIEADYKTKQQMPGPEEDLMHNALVRSSGVAVKETVDGSRGVTNNFLQRDKRVIGYARVTDSNPCYFCALLASRGAFYGKDSFLDTNSTFDPHSSGPKDLPADWVPAKVHNNCKCTLRPVYSKSSGMDAAAQYYRNAWNKTPGKNNAVQINNFRKWLKDHPYPGNRFDLHTLSQDLSDRHDALLNAGFSPFSPQVKWAAQQKQNLAA